MNAIIHGNLQISHPAPDTAHFQEYLENISHALLNEALALQRISIYAWFTSAHVTICISDQGKGFTLEQPDAAIDQPYGHGLMLIRKLAYRIWQTSPNNLYIQFPRIPV